MLMLVRHPGETIVIDHAGVIIEVTVIGTGTSRRVILGFDAPMNVKVRRKELVAEGEPVK